jgi:hypothetical protein
MGCTVLLNQLYYRIDKFLHCRKLMVVDPDRREIYTALLNHFMIWRNYTAFILGDDCNLLLQEFDSFCSRAAFSNYILSQNNLAKLLRILQRYYIHGRKLVHSVIK